jgi:Yip1-like protein
MDLQTRVVNILKTPVPEWARISAEPATVNELITGYAVPLAAIPAICSFIGSTVVGIPVVFVGTIRVGVVHGLVSAVVAWAFALIGVYIAAVIVEKLAPQFRSRGDLTQAMKLVVFAYTPVWLAGVLNIFPPLSVLAIIAGFYAIYLFYLGLPIVMGTPQESVIPYMAVSAIVIIVLTVVLGACAAAIASVGGGIQTI